MVRNENFSNLSINNELGKIKITSTEKMKKKRKRKKNEEEEEGRKEIENKIKIMVYYIESDEWVFAELGNSIGSSLL